MSTKRLRSQLLRIVRVSLALPLAFAVMDATVGAREAEARVVSATARYQRGILVVRGKTARPRQFVSLNRGIIARSNRAGDFIFRLNRLPRSCSVRLWSEERALTVPIRNCPLRRRSR